MTSRLLALTAVLLLAAPLLAHHPFSAEYDWKKPITVTGTVSKVDWSNPHTVKNGESITFDGCQSKSRSDAGNAKSVKLSNGRELSAASSIADSNPSETKTSSAVYK